MKNTLIILSLLMSFSVFSQKIYTTSNLSLQPIVEGGSVVKLGLALGSTTPSGSVTVSFASTNGYFTAPGSLTFTAANFDTVQSVNLAASNNSVDDGLRYDYLTISASGGGYSTSQKLKVQVTDTRIDSAFMRGWPNYSAHYTDAASLTTLRTSLIAEVWNGNGLPAYANADTITLGYTGTIHQTSTASLTGCGVDKLVFNQVDNQTYTWSNKVYLIRKTGGTHAKISFVIGGHGSETGHVNMIQDLIDNDVDVLYCVMPDVSQNTETNPGITYPGVGAHNDIASSGLDDGSYNPLTLFFFEKIKALNYVDSLYSYTSIYAAGCSGGGWSSIMLAAMDTRITKAFDVRGFTPWHFVTVAANADYEQGPVLARTNYGLSAGFSSAQQTTNYTTINYFDLCALACSSGRELHMVHHYNDSCCHGSFVYNLFYPRLAKDASDLGGSIFLELMTDPAYTMHSFNLPDRAYIISKI